jgi:hypothetical protein
MSRIVYTVTATFAREVVADDWLRWLRGGHVAEVLAGGATDAEIVKLDGDVIAFDVRYHFPSRDAFSRYENDQAPRLRADGLRRFPPEKGVAYRRSTGEVIEAVGG